ncbi:MAG: hypothetical protein QCH35_04475 [Methanomicrobiaceae archaeon]|nr:hypothetical protein [Methanomicrobiaceae archaeon]
MNGTGVPPHASARDGGARRAAGGIEVVGTQADQEAVASRDPACISCTIPAQSNEEKMHGAEWRPRSLLLVSSSINRQ